MIFLAASLLILLLLYVLIVARIRERVRIAARPEMIETREQDLPLEIGSFLGGIARALGELGFEGVVSAIPSRGAAAA